MKDHHQYIYVSKLDKLIKNNYAIAYMNDAKWNKLIQELTNQFEQIYLNYKLKHSGQVKGNIFVTPDFKPFFIEPILYKEIEWIEIPFLYEDWANENNRKSGKKSYSQNLEIINEVINGLGQYEMETNEISIKLYGYK